MRPVQGDKELRDESWEWVCLAERKRGRKNTRLRAGKVWLRGGAALRSLLIRREIMKFGNLLLSGVILAGVTTTGFAHAEEAATPAAAAPSAPNPAPSETSVSDGHATGLMVQARVQS